MDHIAIEVGRIGELVRRQSQDLATVIDLQRQVLEMLKENRDRRGRKSSLVQRLMEWKQTVYAVAIWVTVVLMALHLVRGGDLVTALQKFAWLI